MKTHFLGALGASTLFFTSLNIAHAAQLIGLGFPGGSGSMALGISADGSVVVGRNVGVGAFRWTQAGGMVGLGNNLPGGNMSVAAAVSADGSVAVGSGDTTSGTEAFRWTQAGGKVGLGDLPGGNFLSAAISVSADGSVVVGQSDSASRLEAFRWTQAGGMVGLGNLPGVDYSFAYGVSADGSVAVGGSGCEAFRWTQAGGMVGLGSLSTGNFCSLSAAVSADGSVVVGSDLGSHSEAFRWTQAGGMVGLGDLPGGIFASSARALSADGSVVVGESNTGSDIEAFIWDASYGMQSLMTVLAAQGADLTGWTNLHSANGISADGLNIVGYGIHNNSAEAFLAQLDPVPIPPALWLFGSGLLAMFGIVRRRKAT